ncbi:MAG: hypothetical protein Q9204_002274 [Flavoplaca sp. TL-2023a]
MRAELGSQLCEDSSVYISNNPDSRQHTERWSTAAEGDVKFANRINLPFLAINRGHGSVSALGTFKHGVLIKLDNLTSIDVAANGKSAVLGGGVYSDLLLATLAEKNKVAGQNFGIVTKFRYKIFDYPNGQDIFHATYHFTVDQLEILFEHLNRLLNNGTLPRDVNAYVVLRSKPLISPRVSHTQDYTITKATSNSSSRFSSTTSTTSEPANKPHPTRKQSFPSTPSPSPTPPSHTRTFPTDPSKQASVIPPAQPAYQQKPAFRLVSRLTISPPTARSTTYSKT